MTCYKIVEWTCPRNHRITKPCFQQKGICRACDAEDEAKEKRRQRDMRLDVEREKKRKEYTEILERLHGEIEQERRLQRDEYESQEQRKVLDHHRADLARLKSRVNIPTTNGSSLNSTSANSNGNGTEKSKSSKRHIVSGSSNNEVPDGKATKNTNRGTVSSQPGSSNAQADWDYQKQFQRARSDEVDSLMGMIGLEEVKAKFLTIKAQVDTAIRQNVDLKDERFGTVLVGNPGTGMWILCTPVRFSAHCHRQNNNCAPLCQIPLIYRGASWEHSRRNYWFTAGKRWSLWMREARQQHS